MTTSSARLNQDGSATEHPNAQRLREVQQAFVSGDLETVRQSYTDDATWTDPGNGPLSGTYRGWPEIVGMLGRIGEVTGGTWTVEVRSILADDSHSALIYDATSTVAGATKTFRRVLIDELAPDGRVTATRDLAYEQEASDRHMSGQAG